MFKFLSKARINRICLWIVCLLVFSLMLNGCGQKDQSKPGTSTASDSKPKQAFSMGTSSVGSTFYAISIGMGDIINQRSGINIAVEPVGGSDANIRALQDKKIDISMLNAYSAVKAHQDSGAAAAVQGGVQLRLLAQGQESLRNIVARKAANIQTIADLKGKKIIAKRKSLPEIELTAKAMLKAYNVPESDVRILETAETNEAIEALKVGTADAAIIPGGAPASTLSDLAQSVDVVFLSLPEDKLAAVLSELGPAFHKGVIPAGTYKGQTGEVAVPALSTDLVVRGDFPEDSAYNIIKTIMEGQKELAAVHKEGKSWNLEKTLQDPPLPFHPGAVKYFKEVGAWTPELDKWQQEQLK